MGVDPRRLPDRLAGHRAHSLRRGNSGAPFSTGTPPGVTAPGGVLGEAATLGPARRGRAAARSRRWCRAWPATPAGPRSATPPARCRARSSTAGPGSAFHGSVASSSALVSRISRHVASRATWGCDSRPARGWRRRPRTRATAAQGAVGVGSGTDPAALRAHHGGHPGQEVPEVVGQIGVVPGRDALVGEVAVGAERRVAQQVVAHGVDAEVVGQLRAARSGWPSTSTSSRPTRATIRARASGRAGRSRPPCTWPATTRSGSG